MFSNTAPKGQLMTKQAGLLRVVKGGIQLWANGFLLAFWVIKFMVRQGRGADWGAYNLFASICPPMRQPQMLLKCLTFWPMSITVPHYPWLSLLLRPVGLLISTGWEAKWVRRRARGGQLDSPEGPERRPMCTHVWACKNVMLICGLSRPAEDSEACK